ncbi:MAG: hypothetical protein ABJP66_07800 [Hyphomicrobiales bacterium]
MSPDFSKKTVDTIAKRAGYKCSNPECQSPTVGPNSDVEKATVIGEAAHIYGARPKTARYLRRMSDVTRSEITNAIWLCRNCHKIVDRDSENYSADLLFEWRESHERNVAEELGKPNLILRNQILGRKESEFSELPPLVRRIVLDKPAGWEWQLTAELMRHLNKPVFRRFRDLREGLYTRSAITVSDEELLGWLTTQSNEMSKLVGPLSNLLDQLNQAWGAPGVPGDVNEIIHVCNLLKDGLERVLEHEEEVHFTHVSEEFESLIELFKNTLGSQAQKFEEIPDKLDEFVEIALNDHEGTVEEPKVINYTIEFALPENWNEQVDRELKRIERHLIGETKEQWGCSSIMLLFLFGSLLMLLLL